MKKHAFLIMAHNEFTMLKKLIQALDDERNDLYLHIDRKTKYVDLAEISSWVSKSKLVILPRRKIYWGTYSIVECELRMLKTAVRESYSYYHLISGVDLPLQTQDALHSFFDEQNIEFVEYHTNGEGGDDYEYKVRYSFPFLKYVGRGVAGGKGIHNKIARKMMTLQLKYMDLQKKRGVDRTKKYPDVRIYKGSQWFSITDDFAKYLLSKERLIKKMFRWSNGPDEFFVSTVALNSDFKDRVCKCTYRQIDWKRGNPYSYTNEDFDELASADAFFARKVSYNKEPLLVNRILEKIRREGNADARTQSDDNAGAATQFDVSKPLISVIVPCYNVKDYLGECVDSLLGQTFRSFEILLVDDGSKDETGDIIDRYAEQYSFIRAIHKENGGLSSARNAGLDEAKGSYVAFVDSDDTVTAEYLQRLYEALSSSHADMAVCGYEMFENEERVISFEKEKIISGHAVLEILSDIYHHENVLFTVAVNKLYRIELFRDYRFIIGRIHEDEFAAHRLAGASDSVAVIPDVLYRYRIRSGSITSPEKKQDIRHLDYADGMLDRLLYVKNMYYPDLEKKMAETNLRGLYELMIDYNDETVRKYGLIGRYRRRALYILTTHLRKMYSDTRINFLKIGLCPRKMRTLLQEIRRKEDEEREAQSRLAE